MGPLGGGDQTFAATKVRLTSVIEPKASKKPMLNLPDKLPVKQKHLIEAFNTTRPSLSSMDVAKYQKTYARFTNKERPSREFVSKRATLA